MKNMRQPPSGRCWFAATGFLVVAALAAAVILWVLHSPAASAQESWVIRSFDATYVIAADGSVSVTEDLRVDFGSLQRHGIFRDIPVKYRYDSDSNRVTTISDIRVDDGAKSWPFEKSTSGSNLRLKIGDADKLVSGTQRYRISYRLTGGLNPFPDHDELYWNITGNEWEARIETASASVAGPSGAIERQTCFQGAAGSTVACQSSTDGTSASFRSTAPLPPGAGLTVVVGLKKGAVSVPPLVLEPSSTNAMDEATDFLGLEPLPIGIALAIGLLSFGLIGRLWWIAGRDRWFGYAYPLDGNPPPRIRPLFAGEPVVVEYQPPETERRGRRLRPAEIGLLLDERADTLDVTASIVDLAVRNYLIIKETESGGIVGLFKKRDYELSRLVKSEDDLLPYERTLLESLFDEGETVRLSDLKNKFYKDLTKVKEGLYEEATKSLRFFPRDPEAVRTTYRIAGLALGGVGAGLVVLLGQNAGLGIIGIPIALAGGLLALMAGLMPARTAQGRLMYRRCLGFRRYVETAEKDRQAFAEKANIFHEYLPYAIVFECVDKWARAFEGIGIDSSQAAWYVGSGPFVPSQFAFAVNDFSSSVSSVMASTPGGSGSSGFSGGSSGGGGGGGGGGSW